MIPDVFTQTSCERFHMDTAKEIHLNGRDFQHKGKEASVTAQGLWSAALLPRYLTSSGIGCHFPSVHPFPLAAQHLLCPRNAGLSLEGNHLP